VGVPSGSTVELRGYMLAKLSSYTLVGIDALPVEVEVDVSPSSMPKTVLVGLAEAAVRESTHRVERALVNSGYHRPIDRVVINLAPEKFTTTMTSLPGMNCNASPLMYPPLPSSTTWTSAATTPGQVSLQPLAAGGPGGLRAPSRHDPRAQRRGRRGAEGRKVIHQGPARIGRAALSDDGIRLRSEPGPSEGDS
jgi:hypothetical protein